MHKSQRSIFLQTVILWNELVIKFKKVHNCAKKKQTSFWNVKFFFSFIFNSY